MLLDHLKQSAEQLYPLSGGRFDEQHARFIASLAPGQKAPPQKFLIDAAGIEAETLLRNAEFVLRAAEFDLGAGPDYAAGVIEGMLNATFDAQEGWLAWVPLQTSGPVRISIRMRFQYDRATSQAALYLGAPVASLGNYLVQQISVRCRAVEAPEVVRPHDLLIGPGEQLTEAHSGMVLDYSGCATESAVRDLMSGDLPLGRYAFGWPEFGVKYGPDLYLSKYRTGARMMYNGTLICAPQNSGKTRMILRWAYAANRAGINTLLVDVKGNLWQEMKGKLRGEVFHFSTDPMNDDSDGINFLAGLEDRNVTNRMRVRQIVDALLPKAGWEAGEQAYFYQNHVNWLTGLVELTLLYRHYFPNHFVDGEADLSVVYDLAASEQALYRVIDYISAREAETPAAARVEPGLLYWLNEISLLIDPSRGGQRTAEYSYRTLTQSITNALRCFSRYGTLYSKTSKGRVSRPAPAKPRRFFSPDQLNASGEPVTFILAAREQDLDDAKTVVTVMMRRLEHTLFERMQDAKRGNDILLLLDETRRIESFRPEEYITFARQARAGCVLVYQSLDQIGDDKKIRIVLENVGTQIYLGSLVGETARHFIHSLPQRRQPTFSWSTSKGEGRSTLSEQTGFQMVDYLSTAELYRLPGGNWPALVLINSQPRREPILVDMEESN